jgi:phosphatidylglycerol---prolipoprotein diacylglyceryl transferase
MHPVLFTAFGEPVHAYAATSTLGYVVGVLFGLWLGRRDGRPLAELLELALVVVLAALLGSKLFHVLFEASGHRLSDGSRADGLLDLLKDDPWHWARLFEAGYVFYGGVVGAIVLGVLFCLRRGIPDLGAIGDYAVPGILFGTFVGRIGCFLAGCCYGVETAVPWAVSFPAGHPSGGTHVHPVQLYDAAYGLFGLALALFLYKRRRFGGELFLAYLGSYAIFRFATEMLRADSDRGLWLQGAISTSQLISLVMLPLVFAVWFRSLRLVRAGRMRKPREPLAPAGPAAPSPGGDGPVHD